MIRDLTIVLPAYNEALRIEATIDKILAWSATHLDQLELIVVDDGSSDGTGDLVERKYGSRVKVLRRPNGGKGAPIPGGTRARKPRAGGSFTSRMEDRFRPHREQTCLNKLVKKPAPSFAAMGTVVV